MPPGEARSGNILPPGEASLGIFSKFTNLEKMPPLGIEPSTFSCFYSLR